MTVTSLVFKKGATSPTVARRAPINLQDAITAVRYLVRPAPFGIAPASASQNMTSERVSPESLEDGIST